MEDANFNVSFSDAVRNNFTFATPNALKYFANEEVKFWSDENVQALSRQGTQGRPRNLGLAASSVTTFNRVIVMLDEFKDAKDWDHNQLSSFYRELIGELTKMASRCWISSTDPVALMWIESYRVSMAAGETFFTAISTGAVGSISFEVIKGQNLAYEAVMQDESNTVKRRQAEVKTFKATRARLLSKVDEFIADTDSSKAKYEQWFNVSQVEVENLREAHRSAVEADQSVFLSSHDSALKGCDQRLSDMEALLKEKLRMEGPAYYWKKSAYKYRCQGLIWTLALIAWAALALGYFRDFFLAWAGGDRMALNLASLEGAVIFAAIISSFIFMSRVFSKLAFSSFHLQRDAEEREQLTHLYLALSHDLSVDEETRKIVLQSLFSRSETGLLANESGPTMPGVQDVVTSVIKRGG
ncbi:DUF6161 domain-containing protein [Pseudomonas sp. WHRI 8822A]|uniref:DUF6161 domain-containing protein n=1 Tax=Pseudomonas sp. WHRI 8822A TaxID=3162568 RepID=UPI0032EF4202